MSMLEKLCDVKNTFEAKALAVFMAAVLAFSFINISAFADANDDSSSESPVGQTEAASTGAGESATEVLTPTEVPAVNEEPEQSGATVPSTSAPSTSLPIAEPGVAVVGLDFVHAYVKYLDQTIALPAETFNAPLNRELAFAALADEGYELDTVKTVVNGVETELVADEQTGEYKVPADQVTSNLTVKVEAKAVEAPEAVQDSAAKPLTNDGKVDGEGSSTNEAAMPAVTLSQAVDGTVVTVDASAGVLPAGVTMKVVPITGDEVESIAKDKAAEEGRQLVDFVAFDVTLYDVEGNEIQPNGDVSIVVESSKLDAAETALYHADENVADVEKVAEGTEATLDHLSPVMAIQSRDASASPLSDAGSDIVGSGTRLDPYLIPVGKTLTITGNESPFGIYVWQWKSADGSWDDPGSHATPTGFYPATRTATITGNSASDTLFVLTQTYFTSGYEERSQDYYFEIVEADGPSASVLPTALVSIEGDDTVAVAYTTKLTPVTEPNGANMSDAAWTSSNTTIATVDRKGKVSGVSEGEAVITVKVKSESGKTLSAVKTIKVVKGDDTDNMRHYKFGTSSSNMQMFYSVAGGTLTELAFGSEISTNVSNPIIFFVKARDGYQSDSSFQHRSSYASYEWDTQGNQNPWQWGYYNDIDTDDYVASKFPNILSQAQDYGCTKVFYYTDPSLIYKYREYSIKSQPVPVKVSYDLDGGTIGGQNSYVDGTTYYHSNVTEQSNYSFSIPTIEPLKDGATFGGWLVSVNNRIYEAGANVSIADLWQNIAADLGDQTAYTVKIKALWEDLYTVSYDGNGAPGGTPVIDSKQYRPDEVASAQDNTYRMPNNTFSGWNTKADGSGTAYAPGDSITMNGNVTLYAQWGEKGKVLIQYKVDPADTGTVSLSSESVDPDTGKAKGSQAVANRGYAFKNWTDSSGNEVSKEASFTPEMPETGWPGTTVYKANFVKDDQATKMLTYTVKYALDGAEQGDLTKTYTEAVWVNDDNNLAVQPGSIDQKTFTGYRFESIDPEGSAVGTDVASGTTITLNYVRDDAQTQATSYTVNHVIDGAIQKTDTYEGTAWINDANPTIQVATGTLAQQTYEGYKYASISPSVSEGQSVATGTTITLTYVADFSNFAATGFEVTYDGQAHGVQVSGTILPTDTVEFWKGGTKLDANEFVNVADSADVIVKVIRGGQTWTSNPVPAKINAAELTLKANDSGKGYGEIDPVLSATASGLVGNDQFTGSYDVTRAPGENPGTYEITINNVTFDNPNYTVKTVPGAFTIAPVGEVTFVVGGGSKPYDGMPLTPNGFTPIGLAPGDTVEVVYGGSQTNTGTSEGTITDYVIRNAAGEDVTANYPNIVITPGELTVTPAAAFITVNNASKVTGAVDPDFFGTVTGLVNNDDLGNIAYSRTNTEETVGVYTDVITAVFTANPNYTVTVVPGTFTIVAANVPAVPATPTTPTPATPTPAPTTPIGTVPEGPLAPILTPIVEVLEDAVTPLAGPQEETIDDNENPLAGFDVVNCWVHYYLILGIVVTVVYGAGVLVRRINFTRKLKNFENDVLGIEDESAAMPATAPLATEGKEA